MSCASCGLIRKKGCSETFHTFPINISHKKQWITFVNKRNWQPSSKSVLCSKHFTEDCFDRSTKNVRLKCTTVPTIHVGSPRFKYIHSLSSEEATKITVNKPVMQAEENIRCDKTLSEIDFGIESTVQQSMMHSFSSEKATKITTNKPIMQAEENIHCHKTSSEIDFGIESTVQQSMEMISEEQTDEKPSLCNHLSTTWKANNLSVLKTKKNIESWNYFAETNDTPKETYLKQKILELSNKEKLLLGKISKLQKLTHRQKRRVQDLTNTIKKLKNNDLITDNNVLTHNSSDNITDHDQDLINTIKKLKNNDLITDNNVLTHNSSDNITDHDYGCESNLNVSDNSNVDHDYICDSSQSNVSRFVKEIVIYISGFVAKKILEKIKCADCSSAMVGKKEDLKNSLIALKDKGDLTFPSDELINICVQIESMIRASPTKKLLNKSNKETLEHLFIEKFVHKKILSMKHKEDTLQNHVINLIQLIVTTFLKERKNYEVKK